MEPEGRGPGTRQAAVPEAEDRRAEAADLEARRAEASHLVIRRAEVADAEAGAWSHLLCWREAYAGLVDPGRLAERTSDLERRTGKWSGAIAAGIVRWIALNPDPAAPVEDRVVGFSSAAPSRDEDAPTSLELQMIYTRQQWWGSGLANRLLEVAVGKEAASLWVLEGNHRARAFYRRHGFAEDGVRVDEPFFGVPEIRMVRPVQGELAENSRPHLR
jgi:GNAT superfamily N-acetyltransferase